MTILQTRINTRSPEFTLNRDALLKQVEALRTLLSNVQQGAAPKPRSATPHAASCCRASVSTVCWTPVHRFWKSANWLRMRYTAKRYLPLA